MPTSYSILVTGSPTKSQAHLSALRFISAATDLGHRINSVFFYLDAVHVANKFNCKPSDELQLTAEWVKISAQHHFELQVCVAASNRRAVLSADEANQNGFSEYTLDAGYSVAGLGQLAAELSKAAANPENRLLHFN